MIFFDPNLKYVIFSLIESQKCAIDIIIVSTVIIKMIHCLNSTFLLVVLILTQGCQTAQIRDASQSNEPLIENIQYTINTSQKYKHIPEIDNLIRLIFEQLSAIQVIIETIVVDVDGNVIKEEPLEVITGKIEGIEYDASSGIANVKIKAPYYTMIIYQKWKYTNYGWRFYNPEEE